MAPMTAPDADPELLDEAVALLREAGRLTLEHFGRRDLAVDRKGDGTPVTDADRGAERLVRERLAASHPDDTVLGEEEDDVLGTSELTWVVDPIDGTKAFTRGVPLYSNLLAVLDAHGPARRRHQPPRAGLHRLRRAGGWAASGTGERVGVSDRARPQDSVLSTSGYSWWPDPALLAVKHDGFQLRTWGDGYGYALVACGQIEAMVDPEVSLWDVAPMPVDARRGRRPLQRPVRRRPVLEPGRTTSGIATNGLVHDRVVAAFSEPWTRSARPAQRAGSSSVSQTVWSCPWAWWCGSSRSTSPLGNRSSRPP